MWERFISISYKGDLNLGEQFLVQGGWRAGADSKGAGKGLPGDKPTAFRYVRELGAKGETIFLKAIQRVSNSWGHCISHNSCLRFSEEELRLYNGVSSGCHKLMASREQQGGGDLDS